MEIINPARCRLDTDSFFILVDRAAYAGFVAEEWTMQTLQAHVADQGALGRITGASLGPFLQDLPVEVRGDRSARASTREVATVVQVHGEGLHVVDYTELTMAAQFEGRDGVQAPETHARVHLPPGRYRVVFRQLRSEADVDEPGFWESEEPALEVVVEPADEQVAPLGSGFAWFEV